MSFRNKGLPVPGEDLSLEDFDKISNFFPNLSFCGQYSDPIHHPKFIEILEICKQKNLKVEVHVASSLKPKSFYIEAFKAYPKADWVFGIDGLPEESHIYRVNQDGKKLFEIMLESKKYLETKPIWQYIIFKYNQENIDTALELAKENNVNFIILNSSRWASADDPLTPTIRR